MASLGSLTAPQMPNHIHQSLSWRAEFLSSHHVTSESLRLYRPSYLEFLTGNRDYCFLSSHSSGSSARLG